MLIGAAIGAALMIAPAFLFGRAKAAGGHAGHDHGGHDEEGGEEPGDEVSLTPGALRAAGIAVVKAEKRAMDAPVHAIGAVATNNEKVAHVTPRIRGRVEKIAGTLGKQVCRGDELAVLDSVELGAASATYLKSKVAHEAAHANFEREERLRAKEATTEPDYLAAKAADRTAEAELKGARETLLLHGLTPAQIDALSWTQQNSMSVFPIVAPFDGTIIEMHITLGEMIDTADRIFTIADLKTLWVILDVSPKDAVRLKAGQRADLRLEGLPEVVPAAITYVGDLVRTDTRTTQIWCTVDNAAGRLKPGMFVTASIAGEGRKSIAVPADAVQTIGETTVVFVRVDEGRFKKTPVTLGRKAGDWQEILAGVKADDDVATAGSFVLKSEFLRGLMEHSH
jgi:cobalt-zinc-cadmium efflux system membrane fusion protein